jgi:hypothetical protein
MHLSAILTAMFLLFSGCAFAATDPPKSHEGHRDKHDATIQHSFDDVQKWVKRFDDPERSEWQKPATVLSTAKQSAKVLSEKEVLAIVKKAQEMKSG